MKEHYLKLENMFHNHPLNQFYNARISISEQEAELFLPIDKKLFHAADATHGAVYFKALDDAAYFAVNSVVEDVFVLTVSFNMYLNRPISSGEMRAMGKLVNFNRSQYIGEAIIYDSENREIARGSGVYVRSKIALNENLGYQL